MYGVSPQAYDRAITVFSPDGRLFQVEYAKEAVKKGATSIGITARDGVALIASKSRHSNLVIPESIKKIFEVDDHIFVTASGLIADARKLVDIARNEAHRHRLLYNEPAPVESVVRYVCDVMQLYTQYGGTRPFGVSMLIAGINEKPELFEAEPSGAMTGYYADSIGSAKKEVDAYLEKHYDQKMKVDEAIKLGVDALKKTSETKITEEELEIAYMVKGEKRFRVLRPDEIKVFL